MSTKEMVTTAATITAAEAMRRIDDWFRRGYVMFSDRLTQSTHLRRVEDSRPR
ncbi:MAG: hypothetical protein HY900_06960 [Deltaproteobacteria bacterium]|nr:hypothetical protein [Deltaproteobacteria bacterium]